jgi:hypothetical protein
LLHIGDDAERRAGAILPFSQGLGGGGLLFDDFQFVLARLGKGNCSPGWRKGVASRLGI